MENQKRVWALIKQLNKSKKKNKEYREEALERENWKVDCSYPYSSKFNLFEWLDWFIEQSCKKRWLSRRYSNRHLWLFSFLPKKINNNSNSNSKRKKNILNDIEWELLSARNKEATSSPVTCHSKSVLY